MKRKLELQKEIKGIDSKIEKLEEKRHKLVEELSGLDLTKAEKLQNVLNYGGHSPYYISSKSKIMEDFLDSSNRYETIDVEDVVLYAVENYLCEEFEDQLEVEALFGYTSLTKEQFEKSQESDYVKIVDKKEFEKLADDLIKENSKSFEYDW